MSTTTKPEISADELAKIMDLPAHVEPCFYVGSITEWEHGEANWLILHGCPCRPRACDECADAARENLKAWEAEGITLLQCMTCHTRNLPIAGVRVFHL